MSNYLRYVNSHALLIIFSLCFFSPTQAASLSKQNAIYEVTVKYHLPTGAQGSVHYSFTNNSILTYRLGAIELEYVCADNIHRKQKKYLFHETSIAPMQTLEASREVSPSSICGPYQGVQSANIKHVGFTQAGIYRQDGQKLSCGGKQIDVMVEMLKSGKHFRFRTSHGLTVVIDYTKNLTAEQLLKRLCNNPDQEAIQQVRSIFYQYMRSWAEGCQKNTPRCLKMYKKINRPQWIGSSGVRG